MVMEPDNNKLPGLLL